jgi:hypothetical protein
MAAIGGVVDAGGQNVHVAEWPRDWFGSDIPWRSIPGGTILN